MAPFRNAWATIPANESLTRSSQVNSSLMNHGISVVKWLHLYRNFVCLIASAENLRSPAWSVQTNTFLVGEKWDAKWPAVHLGHIFQITLAAINAAFASIPIQAQFCPATWKQAVEIMIPKIKHHAMLQNSESLIYFIHNYSTWCSACRFPRADSFISLWQPPSGHRAYICALNKVLSADIKQQKCQPGILCSDDATSCYDQIVHSAANFCMQQLGVASNTCRVMFGTLQELQHFASSTSGTSSNSYGALEMVP